ncbi:MAG TPA: DNA-3-methyladenine glycosylase family protein [Xenococcaceae cyanobacterium]
MFSSESDFDSAIKILTQRDRDLARVIEQFGNPPQWCRKPGFPTLIRIILEQQVSLLSAKATYEKLCAAVTPLTPENLLFLDDVQLKTIGFSRQKARYGKELAQAIISGQLNLKTLEILDDLTIRKKLIQIKGIGDWTVDMYLMMALQRQDVFPSKDLAVVIAIKELKNLPTRPKLQELELIAQPWQPYRAIATQILWHYYLNR